MADIGNSLSVTINTLIGDIIARRHLATPDDVQRIIERIYASTFSLAHRDIPAPLLDLMYGHGYDAPDRGSDLIYYKGKHVLGDEMSSEIGTHPRPMSLWSIRPCLT